MRCSTGLDDVLRVSGGPLLRALVHSDTEDTQNRHERKVNRPLNERGERRKARPVKMEEGRSAREQEY